MDFNDDTEGKEKRRPPELGNVGFVIDGIDLRSLDAGDIDDVLSGSESEANFDIPNIPNPPDLTSKPDTNRTKQDPLLRQFYAQSFSRNKCFRIGANNMLYYAQVSFSHGVKYSGTISLSQTVMLVLVSARAETIRMCEKEIGCQQLFIALLSQHGFAAGQLLVGLHLNAIGKPRSLGDALGIVRKALDDTGNSIGFQRALATARGGTNMYFTAEADQVLLDSMYAAARAGHSHVATKHVLLAMLGCENEKIKTALDALSLTEKEIRAALTECPDEDNPRECINYFLGAIANSIVRFRLFQGPVKRYREFAVKKGSAIKHKHKKD